MGEGRGGVGGAGSKRVGVRSQIKLQLCNFIPVPAQWGMRLSSIWACSGDLLTSVWGAPFQHTHPKTRTHPHTSTHAGSPQPCQHPSREIRHLETGQPLPMYIFIGLIWHHFLCAAGKRNVFNLHNPHLACSPRRMHRESRRTVKAAPVQHAHNKHFKSVWAHRSKFGGLCIMHANMHSSILSVQRKKKYLLIFQTCTVHPNSGSCARQFEWEDGSCIHQMLRVY